MRIIDITKNKTQDYLEILTVNDSVTGGIATVVKDIIEAVRINGDTALIEFSRRFDRNPLELSDLKITAAEIDDAFKQCEPKLIESMRLAIRRVESYHEKLKPHDLRYVDDIGVTLGARYVPISTVGLYVPGGKANYPSSVIMNAIPAKVAGVKKIVMVCPATGGAINPTVLAAAKLCGVDDIYRIGGAQAVAALAYGTQTIPKVDKVVGPGNAYVAEAKRQLYGVVGIDMIAGPSEILIIADDSMKAKWIAADLLSQAEHDEAARAILITTSAHLAKEVAQAVQDALKDLERASIARESINKNGSIIIVNSLEEAAQLANQIAPEHLELAVANPDALLPLIINAGAVFLGRFTPEAIGDYTAGPSHVLPTAGSARFSSGLSVIDFMKRQSLIGCTSESFAALAESTLSIANSEGHGAHALSVSVRKKK